MKKSLIILSVLFFYSFVYAGSKALTIDPNIKLLITNDATIEPSGDFFRAILTNSEVDPCLKIERINLRSKIGKVVNNKRFCSFELNKSSYSMMPDKSQEAEISNLKWNNFEILFDLSYILNEPASPTWNLNCRLNVKDKDPKISCKQTS